MEEGFYYRINGNEEIPCVVMTAMTLDWEVGLAAMDVGTRSGPDASTYKQYRKMTQEQVSQLYITYCDRRNQLQKALGGRGSRKNEESDEDNTILKNITETVIDLESHARRFGINLSDSTTTKRSVFNNNPFGSLTISVM